MGEYKMDSSRSGKGTLAGVFFEHTVIKL